MSRMRRLQLTGLLASVLGLSGLVASPKAAEAAQMQCYDTCIDAVWEIRCPQGQYVYCDYFSVGCPTGVDAYCVYET